MLCKYNLNFFNGSGYVVICTRVCKLAVEVAFSLRLQSCKVSVFAKYENNFAYVTGHTAFHRIITVKFFYEVCLDFVKLRIVYVCVEGNRQNLLVFHCKIETKQRAYDNRCCQHDSSDYRPKRRLFNRFRKKITHHLHPPLQGGNICIYPYLRKGTIR